MSAIGTMRSALCAILVAGSAGWVPTHGSAPLRAAGQDASRPSHAAPLGTLTPAVPGPYRLWLVPARTSSPTTSPSLATAGFAKGVKLFGEARYGDALPLVSAPALADTPLADYATFYSGLIRLRLNDAARARELLETIRARRPVGFLAEAALLAQADAAETSGDHSGAVLLYAEASDRPVAAPEDVLLRLARSAQAAGDTERAAKALMRVYGEFPLSDLAATALTELEKMAEWPPLAAGSPRYRLELTRARGNFGRR